jgi:mannose-6-phosphate isomerase
MEKSKAEIFDEIRAFLDYHGLSIIKEDQSRPWGGFFVLDENEVDRFLKLFFKSFDPSRIAGMKVSPKILLVAPHCRLSWQYHDRRSEIWTIIRGPVQVAVSETNQESLAVTFEADSTISLKQGQRHRLIGLDTWGIVAEIWQHTNSAAPSDEEDIVRVQDDFNR